MRLRPRTATWLVAAWSLGIASGLSDPVLVWETTSTYATHIGFPRQAVFCAETPGDSDTWTFPYTVSGRGSTLVQEVNLYITDKNERRVGTASQAGIQLGSSPTSAPILPTPGSRTASGHITTHITSVPTDDGSLLDRRESIHEVIPGVLTMITTQTGGAITITSLTLLFQKHGGAEMHFELIWQNGDKDFSRPFTVVDAKDAEAMRKDPVYSSTVPYGSNVTGASGYGGTDTGGGYGNGPMTQTPMSVSVMSVSSPGEALPSQAASTSDGLGPATTTTSTSTITTDEVAATSSANSRGLSTGAKAGIAVGAAVAGLALFAGLLFILLRRRRRRATSRHNSAYFENHHHPELISQKEANVGTVDVTPTSPYFEHGDNRLSVQQPLAAQTRDSEGERRFSQYRDQAVEDGRAESGRAGSSTGRVTPHGTVIHLVEDGMTEEEIRRLEEEERELDQAIEQAGAGRRG